MSGGESAVLRSVTAHVGKENSMLPPLTSPSRVLSLARGQKFVSPKAGHVRRPNADDESKVHRATSPIASENNAPNQQRRIQQLEKSILFMREHHDKIVSALHEEIDELKRKNKELNFRLVMSPASLPAHLLSPEEDQPPSSSPRHQARADVPTHTVQLELMEGELAELKEALRLERERSDQLEADLRQAEADRRVPSDATGEADSPTAELQQRLTAAEATLRQLRRERDDFQRQIQRMKGSVQFRPPWRGGGQPVRPPPPPPPPSGRAARPAGGSQQQLPRLPPAAHKQDTGGGRPLDPRTSSHGSLPALPRGRSRQAAPPPPPPRPPRQ